MLTATVKIRNQWNREEVEIKTEQIDFETIGQLEDYLAYNRSYIKSLSFQGSLKKGE